MANTQTTTTSIPSWIQGPAKTALGDIESWLKSPDNYVYGMKQGEKLFTPLSQSQQESIGNVNWLADQDLATLFGVNKSGELWDRYTASGPQTINGNYTNKAGQQITARNNPQGQQIKGGGLAGQIDVNKYGANDLSGERIVDESGFLGKIDDYMNPFLQQVLDPQIREMNEQLQRGIRDQGASAQMAGAFGDARHGVVDSELRSQTQQNIADVTGRTMASGFDNAMNLRRGDMAAEDARLEAGLGRQLAAEGTNLGFKENMLNRNLQAAIQRAGFSGQDADRALQALISKAGFAEGDANRNLTKDTLNQAARESHVGRLGTGAKAALDLGQTFKDNFMDVNDALFNAGEIERDAQEEQRVATQKFQELIKNKKFDDALKMLGALQGTQYPTSSTSEQESNDGIWGILGSVLGWLI